MIDLIIPVYNAEKTLELTLMSIKMQTIIDKITVYLMRREDAGTLQERNFGFSY